MPKYSIYQPLRHPLREKRIWSETDAGAEVDEVAVQDLELAIPEAGCQMVVHHPDGLHEGVADG